MVSSIFLSNEQVRGYCLAGLKHTKTPREIKKHSEKAIEMSSYIFKTLKGKEQASANFLFASVESVKYFKAAVTAQCPCHISAGNSHDLLSDFRFFYLTAITIFLYF